MSPSKGTEKAALYLPPLLLRTTLTFALGFLHSPRSQALHIKHTSTPPASIPCGSRCCAPSPRYFSRLWQRGCPERHSWGARGWITHSKFTPAFLSLSLWILSFTWYQGIYDIPTLFSVGHHWVQISVNKLNKQPCLLPAAQACKRIRSLCEVHQYQWLQLSLKWSCVLNQEPTDLIPTHIHQIFKGVN